MKDYGRTSRRAENKMEAELARNLADPIERLHKEEERKANAPRVRVYEGNRYVEHLALIIFEGVLRSLFVYLTNRSIG